MSDEILKYKMGLSNYKDCGEWQDFYCKSELTKRAAADAYQKSLECEMKLDSQDTDCNKMAGQFISTEFKKLEISAILESRRKIETILNDPGKYVQNYNNSADSWQFKLEDDCGRQAIGQGKFGSDFYTWKNLCIKEAKEEKYLSSYKKQLERANLRLDELKIAEQN